MLGLLVLWALSRLKGGAGALLPSPSPSPSFPVTPPRENIPPRSATPPGKWKPYPAPIPAAVVARANELLRDKSMRVNEERIEPDPASGQPIRYWKVNQPPGKISVTVWRPNLEQARPAGNAAPSQRVQRSTLTTSNPLARRAPTGRAKAFPGAPGARGAGGGPGFAR